jgi:hypothetical protein
MGEFLVEAYYKSKLIMCLPKVEVNTYGEALAKGKEKMKELKPRMKNHGFNIKRLK